MSNFKNHISDLRHYMKKDGSRNYKYFRALAVLWVLMIFLSVFMVVLWTVPYFAWVNIVLKLFISLGWLVTTVFGVYAWIATTKED